MHVVASINKANQFPLSPLLSSLPLVDSPAIPPVPPVPSQPLFPSASLSLQNTPSHNLSNYHWQRLLPQEHPWTACWGYSILSSQCVWGCLANPCWENGLVTVYFFFKLLFSYISFAFSFYVFLLSLFSIAHSSYVWITWDTQDQELQEINLFR